MLRSIFVVRFLLMLQFCYAQDPSRPYPIPDAYLQTTSILNQSSYIQTFDDQQWYLDNIPFIDVPDPSIQDVYYYRTSVIKRHLKYGHEGHGWVTTEFIQPVGQAGKLMTISASAPHQIIEARWLRNPQYTDNVIQLYTRGGVEILSGITYDNYVVRATYEQAQSTGDASFLTSQLPGMINIFNLWNITFNSTTGLYHRTPSSDAQEFSLPGYLTGGPNGGPVETWNSPDNNYGLIDQGPETYRPDFNGYMVAGAQAISDVSELTSSSSTAQEWNTRASNLYTSMQGLLWNQDLQFWIDVVAGTNLQVLGRELVGYFLNRFDVGTSVNYTQGLEAGLNNQTFLTAYGPTTLEQTNQYFTALKNTTYCCLWQGQSWPFSTCVYLGTLARIARGNQSAVITPEFFQEQFSTYTRTNYKDGIPFTAESHYPTIDAWSADTTNHSEHYFHSTYIDNFFTNLIGIVPTLNDTLVLQPLVPGNWTYFAIENLPYHGSLFSIIWDQAGTQYQSFNHSQGLSIYSNGTLLYNQPTLSAVNITLFNGSEAATQLSSQPRYDNILANPNSPWGLPSVTADYAFEDNSAYHLNDGFLWYETTPDNFWTNNQTIAPLNTINITLPRARTFDSLSLAIIDDTATGGVIACPAAIQVINADGTVLAQRNPWTTCIPNSLNTILFDTNTTTTTDTISVQVTNQVHYAIGMTEIQIWVPENLGPRYEAEDGLLGTFLGIVGGTGSGLNGTISNGGVLIGESGWVEIANVRAGEGLDVAGPGNLTVIGGGSGTLAVQMNFLSNVTITFDGSAATNVSMTVEVDFLGGRNVITLFQVDGEPWVDAIVVG